MKTKKQKELIDDLLLSVANHAIMREIFEYLSELEYNPKKQRSYITFNHAKQKKTIAKTGIRINKGKDFFFALRFSACRGYSQRFEDIVRDAVTAEKSGWFGKAGCIKGECGYCKGAPESHVYTYAFPDGGIKTACGAVALEIPNIATDDVLEIKKLILEAHKYLMKYELGIDV